VPVFSSPFTHTGILLLRTMLHTSAVTARRSIRLPGYDYSQIGRYFITICTCEMRNVFGKIANGAVLLNVIGRIAFDCWREIPEHFAHVELDAFVIMPNHLHGILTIRRSDAIQGVGSIEDGHGCPVPLQPSFERFQRPSVGAIPTIIRSYKQSVTYLARLTRPSLTIWQSNYYERVLRDGKEFAAASRYIFENPMKWQAATHP
jgi:REP-associated tyrosine transposase